MLPALIDLLDISIHALVKRATAQYNKDNETRGISIHALVKRATVWAYAWCRLGSISIHALVKRATYCI